ncbi:MAG: TIGR02221 family CRISPR-associated protein [Bacteroidales bacterium]|nr:TIGR02221 family CRISPR-associated protein [Bacteroidales bacterium]MCF8389029.1 TIGR02221 family CRISPR-associated protein [Bacteroidales bacterium]MCF8398518.1 TIGR02221 family CRISPR-associated protein [Bacteroidales bacterium]
MSRKVFISILGTSYYEETCYFHQNEEPDGNKVRYVQEASIQKLCVDWKETDCIYIFLTEKARETNWKHPAQKNAANDKQAYDGLEKRLALLNLECVIKDVDILDGNTEQEIWEIFRSIYDVLEEEDEVYFDITHAYRYLPMLLMVLINYSKFLKNIEVKQITYGNYEARTNNYSPIIELSSFSQLQDWTSAVHEYTYSGASESLIKIIKTNAKKLKGKQKQPLEKFANSLGDFNNSILTLRGNEIYKGNNAKKLRENLSIVKEKTEIAALDPVLNKIDEKIQRFNKTDELENGEKAVEWCIEHNLWQQALTLGQEHIISMLCSIYRKDYKVKKNREFISKSLGVLNIEQKNKKEKNKKELDYVLRENYEEFLKLKSDKIFNKIKNDFANLSGYRNTYNHAGIIGNIKSGEIIKNFKSYYYNIIEILRTCS